MPWFDLVNKEEEVMIAIDISNSMDIKDCPDNFTRREFALKTVAEALPRIYKDNRSGVSLYGYGEQFTSFLDTPKSIAHSCLSRINDLKSSDKNNAHTLIQQAYHEHKIRKHKFTHLFILTAGHFDDADKIFNSLAESMPNFNVVFLHINADINLNMLTLL